MQWLFMHVPHYAQWYRFWLFWTSCDGLLEMAEVDPTWESQDQSVGAGNDLLRVFLTGYSTEQLKTARTFSRRCCRSTRRRPSASSSTTASGRRRSSGTTFN